LNNWTEAPEPENRYTELQNLDMWGFAALFLAPRVDGQKNLNNDGRRVK